jgi:hypothetical protein
LAAALVLMGRGSSTMRGNACPISDRCLRTHAGLRRFGLRCTIRWGAHSPPPGSTNSVDRLIIKHFDLSSQRLHGRLLELRSEIRSSEDSRRASGPICCNFSVVGTLLRGLGIREPRALPCRCFIHVIVIAQLTSKA